MLSLNSRGRAAKLNCIGADLSSGFLHLMRRLDLRGLRGGFSEAAVLGKCGPSEDLRDAEAAAVRVGDFALLNPGARWVVP
jgi:hypothetical protein